MQMNQLHIQNHMAIFHPHTDAFLSFFIKRVWYQHLDKSRPLFSLGEKKRKGISFERALEALATMMERVIWTSASLGLELRNPHADVSQSWQWAPEWEQQSCRVVEEWENYRRSSRVAEWENGWRWSSGRNGRERWEVIVIASITIGSGRIRSNDNIGRGFSYFHQAHGNKPGIDGYTW